MRKKSRAFFINFGVGAAPFRKRAVLSSGSGGRLIVVGVYGNQWWRRILRRMGIPVRVCQVKVKQIMEKDSYEKPWFFNDITALLVGGILAAGILYWFYKSGILLWILVKLTS